MIDPSDFFDWDKWATGVFSLFPLFGKLAQFDNFFPENYRNKFITFSTIISLIVYLPLQYSYEEFKFYISPYFIAFLGFILLLNYWRSLMKYHNMTQSMPDRIRSRPVLKLFILFSIFVLCMTYSFNVIKNNFTHFVINGKILIEKNGRLLPASSAEIKILKTIPSKNEKFKANSSGKFFKIIEKEDFQQLVIYKKINNNTVGLLKILKKDIKYYSKYFILNIYKEGENEKKGNSI